MFLGFPLESILVIVYGGLFGWVLGKLPQHWIYAILGAAILLTILVLR